MLEERKIKTFTNLEKVFVVVDYEAFRMKCDFKYKDKNFVDALFCGTFGREELKKCREDNCPYVYAIVTEAREDCVKKPTYVQ